MIYYVFRTVFGSGQRIEVDQERFYFYSINPISRCTIRLLHHTRHVWAIIDTLIICLRILLNFVD